MRPPSAASAGDEMGSGPDVELIPPEPGAHLAGTRRLLEQFERRAGGHPWSGPLDVWLDRAEAVPRRVAPQELGLKYDCYLARSPGGAAWGIAVNDRYEGRASLEAATERLLSELPGTYDLSRARDIEKRFGHPGASTTIAVGFDHPQRPPRLKVYLQEEQWGAGLGTLGEVADFLGLGLPDWIGRDTRAGVATVGLLPDGEVRLKAYVGGPDPRALVAGGPELLGRAMAESSPSEGWYYLTIRFDPGGWRYAVNKIYNAVQLGFTHDGAGIPGAWDDVSRLFARAGQDLSLRGELPDDLRVVPTATAIEAEGRSVDVYCAAWEVA